MNDLREQCVSEEPTSGKRCLMAANHDGHRNGGTAWSTDHDAWRAEIDAKDAEIERLDKLWRDECAEVHRLQDEIISPERALHTATIERAEKAEAERDGLKARLAELENALTWDTTCTGCARLLDSCNAETVRREQAEDAIANLLRCCDMADGQGKPELTTAYIRKQLAALDQPGDQEGTTP